MGHSQCVKRDQVTAAGAQPQSLDHLGEKRRRRYPVAPRVEELIRTARRLHKGRYLTLARGIHWSEAHRQDGHSRMPSHWGLWVRQWQQTGVATCIEESQTPPLPTVLRTGPTRQASKQYLVVHMALRNTMEVRGLTRTQRMAEEEGRRRCLDNPLSVTILHAEQHALRIRHIFQHKLVRAFHKTFKSRCTKPPIT